MTCPRALCALFGLMTALACTNTPPQVLDAGACAPSQTTCRGDCVDLQKDDANCGACGVACRAGSGCAGGACYPLACSGGDCGAGRVCVSDACIAVACFEVTCGAMEVCARGACYPRSCGATTCSLTQACVDGACVESACVGVTCPAGSVCLGGLCQLETCRDSQRNGTETDVDCGGRLCAPCPTDFACAASADCVSRRCVAGRCVSAQDDGGRVDAGVVDAGGVDAGPGDAGGADAGGTDGGVADAGSADAGCAAGLTACASGCVSTQFSDSDCGACGVPCPSGQACAGGACYPTTCNGQPCAANRVCLTGACTDKSCFGVLCPAASVCAQGVCYSRACGTQTCAATHACVATTCVEAACLGVRCPAGAVCQGGACRLDTCADGARNGGEADVDCGGAFCAACLPGSTCRAGTDCTSRRCADGFCAAPTCTDGLRNGAEGDVDCGGACPACAVGQTCAAPSQCVTGSCDGGVCLAASCVDGVRNAAETDRDCGGGTCPGCDGGLRCDAGADCASTVCVVGTCRPATCLNLAFEPALETDVDCGGLCAPCANGRRCDGGVACTSRVCTAGTCQAPSCSDRVLNGAESDVDCGGASACARCTPGLRCDAGSDCSSAVCTAQRLCAFPSCSDGVRNGTESDVDCGGTACVKCPGGARCGVATDCAGGACDAGVCGPSPVFGLRPPVALVGGAGSKDLAVADFDGDGHQDVAVVNVNSFDFTVNWGRGNGTFVTTPSIGISGAFGKDQMAIVAADFTGDGRPDVAVVMTDALGGYGAGGLVLYPGAPGRQWLAPIVRSVSSPVPSSRMWAGRINGDSLPDLLTGASAGFDSQGRARFFPSAGPTGFGAGSAIIDLGGSGGADRVAGAFLTGADVNLDGRIDLVRHLWFTSQVAVQLNDGTGVFSPPFALTVGAGLGDPAVGLLNSDSSPDLVVALDQSGAVAVARGAGDGTFLASSNFPAPGALAVQLHDVDADGDQDVLVGGTGLMVLRNDGDGVLGAPEATSTTLRLIRMHLADFDEDGKLDVAAMHYPFALQPVTLHGNGAAFVFLSGAP